MNDIKVLVFDLGGVLFADSKTISFPILREKYGYDTDLILKVIRSEYFQQLRAGLIEEKVFWEWAKTQLPKDYKIDIIKQELWNGYILDQDIYDLILKLKPHYKIMAFSGNTKERVNYLENKYHFKHLFDIELYSFDCGALFGKQDDGFYKEMLKKAGVKSEEILFIDNRVESLRLAKDLVGVEGIVYTRGEINLLKEKLKDFQIKL